MKEVRKRRCPRARIWDTGTIGGRGGEERPAKETEKGATSKVRGKPRESCVLGAEGRKLINKGKDLLGQEDSEVKHLVKQPVTPVPGSGGHSSFLPVTLPSSISVTYLIAFLYNQLPCLSGGHFSISSAQHMLNRYLLNKQKINE